MSRLMKRWVTLLILIVGLTLAALPAAACVGKTLVVGSKGTVQQDLLAQMLSLLISERTGTSVKVVQYDSTQAVHQALLKDDADMYIEYTGVGHSEVIGGEAPSDAGELYKAVKERYNQELNLIWLKPLGFDNPSAVPAGTPSQAAPVVRKETLKKFPALARLINKLGGTIDGDTMRTLEEQAKKENLRQVARRFLKDNRLI